jgi:hypothetical protein
MERGELAREQLNDILTVEAEVEGIHVKKNLPENLVC